MIRYQTHSRCNIGKPLLILLVVVVSQLSLGQAADNSDIEEIIVIGELSKSAVRSQIIRVETR